MVNFDEIIALAMKEGKSIEEIAKEMSSALNEASKPKVTPREVYLNEIQCQVENAIEDEAFSLSDSIAVLTLYMAENHDDWSLEGIKAFVDSITEQIAITEKTIDCVEHDGNIVEVLMGSLADALKSKSKSNEDKSDCTCGSQCHRSDDEKLSAFFKNLGI